MASNVRMYVAGHVDGYLCGLGSGLGSIGGGGGMCYLGKNFFSHCISLLIS